MPATARTRTIAAAPERVWEVVCDPEHLPRWWPGVVRVEGVQADRFTQVVATRKGRSVRMDQRVLQSTAPTTRSWSQELVGTPFERLLSAWTTTITIESVQAGCAVTITDRQDLKGSFKLGLPLALRPARRRLDAALAGLAELFESA